MSLLLAQAVDFTFLHKFHVTYNQLLYISKAARVTPKMFQVNNTFRQDQPQ